MTITLEIPDAISDRLESQLGPPDRAALEALAVEAYARAALTLEQVRVLLGLESRWDVEDVLARHSIWQLPNADDVRRDADTAAEFRSSEA